MVKKSRGDRLYDLVQKLNSVTDFGTFLEAKEGLEKIMNFCVGGDVADASSVSAITKVLGVIEAYVSDMFPCNEKVEDSLAFAKSLGHLLLHDAKPKFLEAIPAIEGGLQLHHLITSLRGEVFKGEEIDIEAAKSSGQVTELQVMLKQVSELTGKFEQSAMATAIKKIIEVRDAGIKLVRTLGDALSKEASGKVEQAASDLRDLSGGVKGGKHWLDGLSEADKANYNKLHKHAQATLNKEPEVASLKTKIDALETVASARFLWGGPRVGGRYGTGCTGLPGLGFGGLGFKARDFRYA